MKYQALFNQKNNEKLFKTVICCSHDWRFRGKSPYKKLLCKLRSRYFNHSDTSTIFGKWTSPFATPETFVWTGSALFAQSYLSQYLEFLWYSALLGNFFPGRLAQSVGHLTQSQRSWFRYPAWPHTFIFLPLNQEGQLAVAGESMCTKYWLTA